MNININNEYYIQKRSLFSKTEKTLLSCEQLLSRQLMLGQSGNSWHQANLRNIELLAEGVGNLLRVLLLLLFEQDLGHALEMLLEGLAVGVLCVQWVKEVVVGLMQQLLLLVCLKLGQLVQLLLNKMVLLLFPVSLESSRMTEVVRLWLLLGEQ